MATIGSVTDSQTYRSPLLDLPGATPANPDDPAASGIDAAGVAWHYGDPLGEQRAAAHGPVFIDRSQRGVLRVAGEEAAEFLNNLLSQKLDDAAPGFTAEALDMDSQGHVAHHAFITRTADAFYLDLPAAQAESLRSYLERMIFWSKVTVESTELGVVTVLGEPSSIDDVALPGVAVTRTVDWAGPARTDFLVPRGELRRVAAALTGAGVQPAGLMTWTAARVAAMEPEHGADLDGKSIAHEVAHWIGRHGHPGAVHLHKGCYRGQETVSRVENIGRSPRLMVLLQLDGSAPELPVPGTDITAGPGGRRVGRLGTVVHHFEDGPVALGLVKRSALSGGQLQAGEAAAVVDPDSLPVDEGEHAGRAAIDRLREARQG
ncbi:CAF17-like 4Fe-4S cluster assembly/insertion protein YgfZ [Corynebacterium frankenforstense]